MHVAPYLTRFIRTRVPMALFFSLALATKSQGAYVIFEPGPFATTWQNPSGATAASASASITVDLTESIGFEPGQPIEIRITPDPGLYWSGFYRTSSNRPFALNFSGTVEVTVGAYSMTYTEGWGFVQLGSVAGGNLSVTNGDGVPHSFIVPWGTDLSEVTITLTDNTSVNGTNSPRLFNSSMSFGGTLVTSSVPEPSAALLGSLLLPAALLRRRRVARV